MEAVKGAATALGEEPVDKDGRSAAQVLGDPQAARWRVGGPTRSSSTECQCPYGQGRFVGNSELKFLLQVHNGGPGFPRVGNGG